MDKAQLKQILEAALLAYGQPLSLDQLREMFDESERPDSSELRKALEALMRDCEGRPVELVEVASGWRLQLRSAFAARLSRLWQERPGRYSRALLETIALIAYRQPITRGEIEDVRGVTVNPNIVRTLTERGWIRVVGHREVPGHPELLGTTREFLDYFGLKSLDELPTLAALKDMEAVGIQLEFAGAPTVQAAAAGMPAANDAEAPS
ncbi:MAG: SMC-Scp complex subunit ScpB [Gammaproteobacteria bacterium]